MVNKHTLYGLLFVTLILLFCGRVVGEIICASDEDCNNGVCMDGPGGDSTYCQCNFNYFGSLCLEVGCGGLAMNDPKVCGGTGVCVAKDTCVDTCFGVKATDPSVCSGRGVCTNGTGICSCPTGYWGNNCEYGSSCNTTMCSNLFNFKIHQFACSKSSNIVEGDGIFAVSSYVSCNKPHGIVNKNGDIYFSDAGLKVIRKVTKGVISTLTTLSCSPESLILDNAGDIAFRCQGGSTINKYSFSTNKVTNVTTAVGSSILTFTYDASTDVYYFVKKDLSSSIYYLCSSKNGSDCFFIDLQGTPELTIRLYNNYLYMLLGDKITRWYKDALLYTATTFQTLSSDKYTSFQFNSKGDLFLLYNYGIVRLINGFEMAIGGIGSGFGSGNGGDALSAQIVKPREMVFAEFDNIIFTEQGNGTVRILAHDSCLKQQFVNQTTCDIACSGLTRADPSSCNAAGKCKLSSSVENGTTIYTSTCDCNVGYNGNTCQNFACFGKLNTDPSACSANGVCMAHDTCSCTTGFYGDACDCTGAECLSGPCVNTTCEAGGNCSRINGKEVCQYECNGISSSSSNVCSGHGSCVGNCICKAGWNGTDCSQPMCNGILASDPRVCSGEGSCLINGLTAYCSCNNHHYGPDCSEYMCNGIFASNSKVCSGHGKCNAIDQCTCSSGWAGSLCDVMVCDGIPSTDPSVCNGGYCLGPNHCQPDYYNKPYNGYYVYNINSYISPSAIGEYVFYGQKINGKLYISRYDEIKIIDQAKTVTTIISYTSAIKKFHITKDEKLMYFLDGGNGEKFGVINLKTRKVILSDMLPSSYTGLYDFCIDDETSTVFMLTRSDKLCKATVGVTGVSDTVCVTSAQSIWYGRIGFYNNKIFIIAGALTTRKASDLSLVETRYFVQDGSRESTSAMHITRNGIIFFMTDKFLYRYDITVSTGNPKVLAGQWTNGRTGDGGAALSATFGNPSCVLPIDESILIFDPIVASQIRIMTPKSCPSEAFETSSNKFIGSTCDISCNGVLSNETSVCSGNGFCKTGFTSSSNFADPRCVCTDGATGNNCENTTCFGISNTNSSVCNGHGSCVGVDKCSCYPGYGGKFCSEFACDGIAASSRSVCGGSHNCTGPNYCEPNCYGIGASRSSVCSGEGVCSSENNCTCFFGRNGSNCEGSLSCDLPCEHGVCKYSKGEKYCSCSPGFTGALCELNACTSNAQCTDPLKSACSMNVSSPSYHGCVPECLIDDDCYASVGRPICKVESAGAICIAKSCSSASDCANYMGNPLCTNNVCSPFCSSNSDCGYGTCIGAFKNGSTIVSPYCKCNSGYTGEKCSIHTCFGILNNASNVCSGQGSCISADTCSCIEDTWAGSTCSVPVCFGIAGNLATACSGYKCLAPNQCEIPSKFTGLVYSSHYTYNINNFLDSSTSSIGEWVFHGEERNGKIYISRYDQIKVINPDKTVSDFINYQSAITKFQITMDGKYMYFLDGGNGERFGKLDLTTKTILNSANMKPAKYFYQPNWEVAFDGMQDFVVDENTGFIYMLRLWASEICKGKISGTSPIPTVTCVATTPGNPGKLAFHNGLVYIVGAGSMVVRNATDLTKVMYTKTMYDKGEVIKRLVITKNGVLFIMTNLKLYRFEVNVPSASVVTIAGSGTKGLGGIGGSALLAQFQGATSVAPLSDGRILIFDPEQTSYIRVLEPNGCPSGNFTTESNQFIGSTCEVSCDGILSNAKGVCNGNGYCVSGLVSSQFSDPQCVCNDGSVGVCPKPTCSGLSSSDANVCGGRGTCDGLNQCTCNNGYTGDNCEYFMCNTVSSQLKSVCSGSGNCTGPNVCTCLPDYTGINCHKRRVCQELKCNNGGNCTTINAVETCICPSGFSGKSCDRKTCNSKSDCPTPGKTYCAFSMDRVENTTKYSNSTYKWCRETPCTIEGGDEDCKKVDAKYPKCVDFDIYEQNLGRCVYEAVKMCTSNSDCALNRGYPLCDASTWTCVSAKCTNDTGCHSYGYSKCNSGICDVECWSNQNCTNPGFERCGNNANNTQQYRLCLPSCRNNSDCLDESRPTCDVANRVCQGISCSSNETCQAQGFFKCGLDGNCAYECQSNAECPSNLPYCNKDKSVPSKYNRCTVECSTDSDCTKYGKTSCGTNNKDPQTYQRCYNKECLDNEGCVSVRGKPRCDTSVFRCIGVSCYGTSDCTPFGYPNCNSNGTCDVDCMVHSDCKLYGYTRCGMSSSNVKEYHKCVASCENGKDNCDVCASDRITCSACAANYAWDGKSCIVKCNTSANCLDELKPICDSSSGLCKAVTCSTNTDCTAKGFQICTNGTCGFECVSNSDCKDQYFPVCGSNKNVTSTYRKCIGECATDSDCNGFYGRPSCVTSGSSTGGRCSKVPCYPALSQCNHYSTNSKCLCTNSDCYCRPECTSDNDCTADFRRVCDSTGTCVKKTCSNETECPYKGYSYCDTYDKYCKAECTSNGECQLSSSNPLLNTCSKKDDMTLNRCVEGCKKDADCEGITSSCDVSHATCTYRFCTDHSNCTTQGYTYCGSTLADKKYCDRECSYDTYCDAKYANKPICSKKEDSTLNTCVPECVQDSDCAGVVSKKKCNVQTGRCVAKPCSVDGDCSEAGYSFCGSEGVCTFECLGNSQCASKFGKTKCNLVSGEATYQRCVPECSRDLDCLAASGRPICNQTSSACEPKTCKSSSDCAENGFTACKNAKCVPECSTDRDCIGVVKNGYLNDVCDFNAFSSSKKTCIQFPIKCTTDSQCSYAGFSKCKSELCSRECMYDSDCPNTKPYCEMSRGGGYCTNQPCLVNSDCTFKGYKQCWSKSACVQTECSEDYQCSKGVCITDYNNDLVYTCQTQCNSTLPCKAANKVCLLEKERCVDITCKTNDECSAHAPYTTCRNAVCKQECESDAHCTGSSKFCDLYKNQCVPEIVCSLGCVNGTCYNNTNTGEQKCICNAGYTGPLCAVSVDQICKLNCLNGGVCQKDKCVCPTGFNGELCQNIDQKPNPCTLICKNGGSCVNTTGIAKCQCLESYFGDLCQEKSPNPCTLQCGAHGTCLNTTGIASCVCKDSFEGEKCSVCKTGFTLVNSLCVCNTSSGRILSDGECVCNAAANYQTSGNQCIRKQAVCEFTCGTHGVCAYRDDKTTATDCTCDAQWVTSDVTKPCSVCDESLGLILSNGVCVCNAELGFTQNEQGKCVRNTSPKCNVDCGSNGVCDFETSTSTVSVCKCKNGFVTIDQTKPCSSCPAKTVQGGAKCVCDTSSGYTDDTSSGCSCDVLKGFKTDATGQCVCNSENGFTKNGKACVCAVGFENTQGKCLKSEPKCSSPCGNGECQFVNIAISTEAICKCNKGYTTKVGEIPCSSCASEYTSSNGACKKVCPSEYSGENCEIYTPSIDCVTLPSTSLSFCKSSVDYTVLNSLYNAGAQNATHSRLLLARNAAVNDALAREEYNRFIGLYTKEGKACDEKCIATLTKFACYMKFQSCSKRDTIVSTQVCKSVCDQVVKTELTTVPDAFAGLCDGFSTSNCFYGSFLPSDTTCYGLSFTSSSVCSGKGKCSSLDNCVCAKGYTGSKCESPICYEKESTNSQVCSGRGQCVGVNTCKCNTGFTGPECQVSTCNGKMESEGGCSFRGSCTDSHTCACSGNFAGSSCSSCKTGMTGPNCDIPICNGVKATDNSVCSGKGKCVIENSTPVCKCNTGFDGISCQNFKCNDIDRSSALVCGGRGKCTSYNTCVCSNSTFDALKFCTECSPSYTGPDCSEKMCSDEVTCSGHGKCDASFKCGCNGNWVGEFCNKCKSGFIGTDCQFECSPSKNCNSRGSCNMDGSCTCQAHATGAQCESCESGWFGEKCDFSIDSTSFGFSVLGDSISGVVYSSLKKKFLCSELIENHEILGVGAKCLLNSEKSSMDITLGPSASISIGGTLQFKNYFGSSQTTQVIVKNKEYLPLAPTASLTADKASVSKACGSIYLDASGSISLDRRSLIFTWSTILAPTTDDSDALDALIASQSGSGVKISGQTLGIGSYSVQVSVTSTFSQQRSTASVSFQISDLTSPTVSIKEGLESTMIIGKTSIISPTVSFPSCYGGSGPLSYLYTLDTAKSVDTVTVNWNKELLVFSNEFTKISVEGDYNFVLTVSQQGAATVNVPFKVTAKALPLIVSFSTRDMTQSFETPVTFNVEKQDPSNPTETSGSISLSCVNLLTAEPCFAPIIDDVVPFQFSRSMEAGVYSFTSIFSKGLTRASSANVKITVTEQPKSKIIRASIVPPADCDTSVVDPSNDFILQASNQDSLSSARIYSWSSSDLDLSSTTTNLKYIQISKALLVPGAVNKVSLSIVDGDRSGNADITFTVNSPPTVGILEVNPTTGVALKDEFQIKCGNGWYDPQVPLSYEFLYKLTNDSTWSILSSKSEKKSIATSLPAGTLDIKVIVYDANGASSETTTQIVTTVPSPQEALAALTVSQQGSVTVSSISSALSVVGSVSAATPAEKEALKAAGTAFVDKYFKQADEQGSVVAETSDSVASKVSVISSIGGCVDNLADSTVSLSVSKFSDTTSTASSSGSIKMNDQDVTNSKNSAAAFSDHISSTLRRAFTLDDMSRIQQIFSDLVNVQIKNLVADMPAVKTSTTNMNVYARLVSISTLEGLIESVDSTTSFNFTKGVLSLPEFNQVESVKLYYKTQSTTMKSAISKIVEFSIFNNNQQMSFNTSQTIATIAVAKLSSARNIQGSALKCFELQNGTYVQSTHCNVLSENEKSITIETRTTGSFLVQLVSQAETSTVPPKESLAINPVPPKPDLDYISLILLIIPVIALIVVAVVVVVCVMKKRGGNKVPKKLNEKELLSV